MSKAKKLQQSPVKKEETEYEEVVIEPEQLLNDFADWRLVEGFVYAVLADSFDSNGNPLGKSSAANALFVSQILLRQCLFREQQLGNIREQQRIASNSQSTEVIGYGEIVSGKGPSLSVPLTVDFMYYLDQLNHGFVATPEQETD